MGPALRHVVAGAHGASGHPRNVDLGASDGPLQELAGLLTRCNGFFACNSGVQAFRAGSPGLGPELQSWNQPGEWKNTYGGLTDGLFSFGQDLFGVQFAIRHRTEVVTFHPESGGVTTLGRSLEDWASWLLDDLDVHGCRSVAAAWQDEFGTLGYSQRLIPWRLFTLGGSYDFANLTAKDAAKCMRIRGPFAQRIHELSQGSVVTLGKE
ncbi:SMI1/KNR4 family protein [Saccharopolyspora endophytica]|uniref:SMI1/KNR4 family protein n=1 Tax=Saccharopolyspora endophytica TaxID=543886 RepID=UPI001B39B0E8|nr:SMI1/KNR4 family protein [Saccharopolyspora endophytica]